MSKSPKGYVSVTQEELIPMEEFLSSMITSLQEKRDVMEEKYQSAYEKFNEELDKVITDEVAKEYYEYYHNKYIEVKTIVPEKIITGRKLFGVIPLKAKTVPEHTTWQLNPFDTANFSRSLANHLQRKLKDICKVDYHSIYNRYPTTMRKVTINNLGASASLDIYKPCSFVTFERNLDSVYRDIRNLVELQQTLADFISTGKTCHIDIETYKKLTEV